MTTDKRRRMEAIIRALQAKTIENGATQEEALAATEKAKELMDRYEIEELSDEEIVAEGAVSELFRPANLYEIEIVRTLSTMLCQFTETKCMWVAERRQQKVRPVAYIGLRSDVDLAIHMIKTLVSFGMVGIMTIPAPDRLRYLTAYSMCVSKRLKAIVEARNATKTTGSRAIVVVDIKTKAVEDWFSASGIKMGKPKKRVVSYTHSAYSAGYARGHQAPINHSVGGNQGRLQSK